MNKIDIQSKLLELYKTFQRDMDGLHLHSCLLVGSVARGDCLPDSDLDLLIIFRENSINYTSLQKAGKLASACAKKVGLKHISPQPYTIHDLFHLSSVPMLLSYQNEGLLLYGDDIRKDINEFLLRIHGKPFFKLSVLSRIHFQRQRVRQALAVSLSGGGLYMLVMKSIFFIMEDGLYLKKMAITNKNSIIRTFKELYTLNIAPELEKVLLKYASGVSPKKIYSRDILKQGVNFIEQMTDLISNDILKSMEMTSKSIWSCVVK